MNSNSTKYLTENRSGGQTSHSLYKVSITMTLTPDTYSTKKKTTDQIDLLSSEAKDPQGDFNNI